MGPSAERVVRSPGARGDPSTLREAADRDDVLTVLADRCADADPEIHRVLVEGISLRQAEITAAAGWAAGLAAAD